jgi:hypothetical protein
MVNYLRLLGDVRITPRSGRHNQHFQAVSIAQDLSGLGSIRSVW